MNREEALRQYAEQKSIIDGVLKQYVSRHGCPCSWPQFEYWVGKPHGNGWEDTFQNELIASARALPCFYRPLDKLPEYGHDIGITCSNCGSKWWLSSEEWRMGAYHDRLTPIEPKLSEQKQFGDMVSASYFATAGYAPVGKTQLSVEQWAEFMLGHPYRPVEESQQVAVPQEPPSIWRRIVAKLSGHT